MTQAEVESQVESWNWNASIFDIYDELRENHTAREQEQLLTYTYKLFNKDSIFLDLANHLGIYNIEE